MKVCTKCNIERDITEFRVNKGYTENVCKDCNRKLATENRRTVKGLISKIYSHQKQTSTKRGHELPTYTLDELYEFVTEQEHFKSLYNKWVESRYDRQYTPSIDRLDDRYGYSLDNIQLVTWKQNNTKQYEEIGEEHNNKYTVGVVQYDLEGNKLKEFISVAEASRNTRIAQAGIINCCKGTNGKKNIYRAGQYQFRYANEASENIGPVTKKKLNGGPKGKTGVKGVTMRNGKYTVAVYHNKKRYYIGEFTSLDEASEAYKNAKVQIKGK